MYLFRLYHAVVLIPCFFVDYQGCTARLTKKKKQACYFLSRWYWKVSGDQALRETSPSMMSRWRKGNVEAHRPVSSIKCRLLCPSYLNSRSPSTSLRLTRGDLILDKSHHWTTISWGKHSCHSNSVVLT